MDLAVCKANNSAHHGATWRIAAQLGASRRNSAHHSTTRRIKAQLGASRRNLAHHGATRRITAQLGASWRNSAHRGATWRFTAPMFIVEKECSYTYAKSKRFICNVLCLFKFTDCMQYYLL